MKKQVRPIKRAHFIRSAVYLLLLLAVCTIPLALAQSRSRGTTKPGAAKPASIIVVTNTNDSGPGSLRDALASANNGDTIDATGVSGTILLTSGELQINRGVTINGPGAENLAVNGNATFRVFENLAANVTISGFTITNGFTTDTDGGGGILNPGALTLMGTSLVNNVAQTYGGGISGFNGGNLTVMNSVITKNSSGLNGGGIAFNGGGTLTVTNSVISDNDSGQGGGIHSETPTVIVSNSTINGNMSTGYGGGIFANMSAYIIVINSTISGNMGSGEGGGIYNVGGTTITNSTISDNLVSGNVGQGGGIENNGVLTITNSTISGNVATDVGGGVSNFGYFTATNSTFSGNSATDGGGIYISGLQETNAQIGDSVLNAGASGGTIRGYSGNLTSLGYNLASDDGGGFLTGPGDQINTDPMLGPLQDNGGPTFTHALLPGSPAIDAGDPSFTPPPFYDQRGPGFDRVVDGRIDIGSFEVQGPTPTPTPTATPRHSPLPRPRPTPPPRQ